MQVIGPLVVSAVAHVHDGFIAALWATAGVLMLAAIELWRSAGHATEAAQTPSRV